MTSDNAFAGKTVLVTGAGQGIGRGICARFAEAGASVVLNDIDPQRAEAAAAEINQACGAERVRACAGDISDVEAVRQLFDAIPDLDIFVANAGVTHYGSFLEVDQATFDHLTSVNLRGTYFCCQAAAKKMIAAGRPGRIVLMSSVCGVQSHKNLGAYGMTKAAIRHLAKCLADEISPHGITVNAIGAGATLTERTLEDDPEYERNWNAVAPNRRTATVDDIADTVLFLASEQARHITGEIIMVDGGWTAVSPVPSELPQVRNGG